MNTFAAMIVPMTATHLHERATPAEDERIDIAHDDEQNEPGDRKLHIIAAERRTAHEIIGGPADHEAEQAGPIAAPRERSSTAASIK